MHRISKLKVLVLLFASLHFLMSCTSHNKTSNDTAANLIREKHWTLVWNDEFNGNAVDVSKWSYARDCWGGGNNEQQCYTDRDKNVFVSQGNLNLIAFVEKYTGPKDLEDKSSNHTLQFTSGKLQTSNKGDWKYGRFEIRAKLPHGQGIWPAIWMLPTESLYGMWPTSGEIDILEAVNLKTQSDKVDAYQGEPESRVHSTIHFGEHWPKNASAGNSYKLPKNKNPADQFYTYALEWEEGEIRWYVDDIHHTTIKKSAWNSYKNKVIPFAKSTESAPFDQKFHIILNLAVGGKWPVKANDKGVDRSQLPQSLLIDYVRVYQCSLDPIYGRGCATVNKEAKIIAEKRAD